MNSQAAINRRQWFQFPLFLLLSIFGGIISHNVVSYLPTSHISAHTIHTRSHLETRDEILERNIGDFFNSIGAGLESAVGSVLPNASSIIGSLAGAVNGSGLLDGLAEPAKFLGVGLGNGALTGLNMTVANSTTPAGVDGIAQNLGSGLTSSIFSSSSIKSLMNSTGSSLGSSGTVGQAALALAQGLGGGAASGLNLSSKAATYNTSGISGIAGNFGQGLSSSFVGGIKLPSLSSLTSTASTLAGNSSLDLGSIGAGFGSGIGQGAAIGLGLQKNEATAPKSDAAGITQGFARGLVSSFLENGTLTAVMKSFSAKSTSSGNSSSNALGGLSLSSIDFAKAAEGMAVGLVSGVGSTISSLKLINADTTSFNDSVGGVATGFGRGLGSEGAKLVEQWLAPSSSKTASKKRSPDDKINGAPIERSISLRKRDTTTVQATDLASVLANLNASNINPLLQVGINDLTCEGIGGLVGVFLGLVQSKKIDLKAFTSTTSSSGNNTLSLPNQLFIIKSDGNTYSLNPSKSLTTITVNGQNIVSFVIIAAAHIFVAILAYFFTIPLIIILINTQRLSKLLGKRHPAAPTSKWQTFLTYIIIPLSILTLVMGVIFGTGRKHFATPHETFGLIVFAQTLLAAGTTILIQRPGLEFATAKKLYLVHYTNLAGLLLFSLLTVLFGFTDLSSVALCATQAIVPTSVWMALGWLLLTPFMLAISLQLLVFWLGRMRGYKDVSVKKGINVEDVVDKKGGEIKGGDSNV